MGTNYYLEAPAACQCCGRPYDALHIGKASYGWCFSLHVIPEVWLNSLHDWTEYVMKNDYRIFDEYGEQLSWSELLRIIKDRSYSGERGFTDADIARMGAERGPNGLLRHKLDGVHCVGHGPGTWDYIAGNFL